LIETIVGEGGSHGTQFYVNEETNLKNSYCKKTLKMFTRETLKFTH